VTTLGTADGEGGGVEVMKAPPGPLDPPGPLGAGGMGGGGGDDEDDNEAKRRKIEEKARDVNQPGDDGKKKVEEEKGVEEKAKEDVEDRTPFDPWATGMLAGGKGAGPERRAFPPWPPAGGHADAWRDDEPGPDCADPARAARARWDGYKKRWLCTIRQGL